jgi:ribosomal protein L7/L12
MKMDRLKFAALISYITALRNDGGTLQDYEIERIDNMTKLPVGEPVRVPCVEVDNLLRAIKDNKKIEAIKAYRTLTGAGLKESKDAVEGNYWYSATIEDKPAY